ncbi:DUF4154 domain-containing protein [Fulvivirgaceae bacterium PWU4]|uniref:DUF4154 domain-containing protein n=1 Tax=Chryseosolibacter histidini TaxID=2782349 RepID=A0AAP2DP63_9BACT|nr:YfiR family protein [Chryseosolibacter histidini]MBT1698442.1 DUF4154 domain-containing protein [Chryseosolibacter histidini]
MKRRFIISMILFVRFFSTLAQSEHDQAHALLLLGIAQNTDFPVTSKEYTITILGKSPIYEALVAHSRNMHINGLPVKVVEVHDVHELTPAQIIYVTNEMNVVLASLASKTAQQPLLIVGAHPDHFKMGAEFSIVQLDSNTFRYNINKQALDRRNIRVSRTLINSAHTVIQ